MRAGHQPGEALPRHVAFMELGPKTDQRRVVTTQGKAVAAFEMKCLRAFVWDVSGASLYALSLAGRTRGRVAVCDVAAGTQAEATVVSSVEETSLAMSPEKGTVWMAGGNPETRITGLFKMKSTGNNSPWSLALRMPGPWSSIAVHPVSGIVHGLLHIEGALQLVNEGKPRSPLEVFFKGVDTKAATTTTTTRWRSTRAVRWWRLSTAESCTWWARRAVRPRGSSSR